MYCSVIRTSMTMSSKYSARTSAPPSYSFEGALPSPPPQPEGELAPKPFGDVVRIDIYVNERYSPRLGFSPKGLMLSDRGPFSTSDGSAR
jgi:hypothetical protein